MSEQTTEPGRPSALERLFGGRPGGVIVRLVLLSLVVGLVMALLGLDPQSLLHGVIELVQDTLRDSTGMLRSMAGYVATGVAIVVPVWLVLRLTARR